MDIEQLLQEICENNGIQYMHSSWGKGLNSTAFYHMSTIHDALNISYQYDDVLKHQYMRKIARIVFGNQYVQDNHQVLQTV